MRHEQSDWEFVMAVFKNQQGNYTKIMELWTEPDK